MLVKRFPKLIAFIGPFLVLGYLLSTWLDADFDVKRTAISWSKSINDLHGKVPSRKPPTTHNGDDTGADDSDSTKATLPPTQESLPSSDTSADDADDFEVNHSVYREVFSVSTADGKYFPVDFGPDFPTLNPNIIPHPSADDTWIIVAQREKGDMQDAIFEELVCNAVFQKDGSLGCATPPTVLPVAPTYGENCKGKLEHFGLNRGPHDMRMFYGPAAPLTIFGSQSVHTCFGLWAQDLRTLVNYFGLESLGANLFSVATELQRPPPWGEVEKNWFLFWDSDGGVYVHHDVEPSRVFAQIAADGSVGPDLAPLATTDWPCMAQYMPKRAEENENLHQATNSLAITLCNRNDPSCLANDDNTFVMTIFQHKSYWAWHATYEPYIMLFQQKAPFAIHSISQKPLWIHGRGMLTKDSGTTKKKGEGENVPEGQSEMFYITSMSWKEHGQTYHGYLDDVLFLSFGIEDSRTAAIDVLASDILQDLGLCSDVDI